MIFRQATGTVVMAVRSCLGTPRKETIHYWVEWRSESKSRIGTDKRPRQQLIACSFTSIPSTVHTHTGTCTHRYMYPKIHLNIFNPNVNRSK